MKIATAALLALTFITSNLFAATPAWDNSGNGQLNGIYYFRLVLLETADTSGNIDRALALYGNVTFNSSAGTYALSGYTLSDSSGGFPVPSTGTYAVSASGYGLMSNPLVSGGTISFLVSNHIAVGSDTESGFNDVFVAAPATASFSNSNFQGSYTMAGYLPVLPAAGSLGGSPAGAGDLTFQLNPDGAGHLNTVSLTGSSGGGQALTQSSGAVTYAFSNGGIAVKFPNSNTANFFASNISGSLFLYLSPDTNFVFGGTQNGFDLVVGVKNAASGASTPISGLYYEAGLDESAVPYLDSYYGAFNAYIAGNSGNILGHERFVPGGSSAYGDTYYQTYPAVIANTYQDSSGTTQYTIGASGIRIATGIGQYLSIGVALPYTPPAPVGSVYVDPTGIVNTASSAPYTAGISPGDFLTLYNGVNLAGSTAFAPPGAFPTILGGVQVLVDGVAAPLYYVTPTQISFLVPYVAGTYSVATIQVNNNGTKSNVVTTPVHQTTPGVFTSNPIGGPGYAAMLDFPPSGGYYIVGADNPVHPGDNIALFLTGLGNPFPPNGDGQLGGTNCVSGECLSNSVAIDIGGTDVGTLAFAGLAPGLAGLYQVNFQVPATVTPGAYSLGVNGFGSLGNGTLYNDSYTTESIIPVAATGSSRVPSTGGGLAPAARKKVAPRLGGPLH